MNKLISIGLMLLATSCDNVSNSIPIQPGWDNSLAPTYKNDGDEQAVNHNFKQTPNEKDISLSWHVESSPPLADSCKKGESEFTIFNNSGETVKYVNYKLHIYKVGQSTDLLGTSYTRQNNNYISFETVSPPSQSDYVISAHKQLSFCINIFDYLPRDIKSRVYVKPELISVEFYSDKEFIPNEQ
jgi:hypothetical protein